MRLLVALRIGALSVAPTLIATSIVSLPALALAPTSFVSWSPGVISIRAAVGTETTIAFAPGEQITFAEVDDAVRWDAHEAPAVQGADDTVVQRVGVVPSEVSATNMTVRTDARTYRIHLVAVQSGAPTNIAFTFARTFISRPVVPRTRVASTAQFAGSAASREADSLPPAHIDPPVLAAAPGKSPATASASATPTPRMVAVVTPPPPTPQPAATPVAVAIANSLSEPASMATPNLGLLPPPATVTPMHVVAPDSCPPTSQGASQAVGGLTVASQIVNAGVTAAAVKHGATSSIVLGLRGFGSALAFSFLEDRLLAVFTKRWCAADQNKAALLLTGANVFNAVHSGVRQ